MNALARTSKALGDVMLAAILIVAAALLGLGLLVYGVFLLLVSTVFDIGAGVIVALVLIFFGLVALVWAKRR